MIPKEVAFGPKEVQRAAQELEEQQAISQLAAILD